MTTNKNSSRVSGFCLYPTIERLIGDRNANAFPTTVSPLHSLETHTEAIDEHRMTVASMLHQSCMSTQWLLGIWRPECQTKYGHTLRWVMNMCVPVKEDRSSND